MRTLTIGCDPGSSGSVCLYCNELHKTKIIKLDKPIELTLPELNTATVLFDLNHSKCYIEAVHSMPGQGVASSFKFGKVYGEIRTAIISLGIPVIDVTPQKWMKHFGFRRKKNETKTQRKNRIKAEAQKRYPSIKVTNANADAIMIMEYGREINGISNRSIASSINDV